MASNHLKAVAEQFICEGRIVNVREHGSGNVNDTFLVTTSNSDRQHFVLQRINSHVFATPEKVVANLRNVSVHIRENQGLNEKNIDRQWQMPFLIPTRRGEDYYIDDTGDFWRAVNFIEKAKPLNIEEATAKAIEAGWALGRFHRLMQGLDPGILHDTLPGFHNTPLYLKQYDKTRRENNFRPVSEEERFCVAFIEERRDFANVLEEAKETKKIVIRIIHGDPKADNIMINDATGRAVGMIDLDTVGPGLIHYDVGDCLRSCCNLAGEEVDSLNQVRFDTDRCVALLQGYVSQAKSILTDTDFSYFYAAIRLLPFELGLRFFTDYFAGNIYFKARDPQHNLRRALVQFRLAESIESQKAEIEAVITSLQSEM